MDRATFDRNWFDFDRNGRLVRHRMITIKPPVQTDENLPVEKLKEPAELAEDGEHKLQGRINFQGLDIAVENREGSVRSGKKPDGGEWHTRMLAPYGYIDAPSKGKDGESIDCYVGPKKDAPSAFVVHQHKPDGTGFDEDKVMLGTNSEQEAKKLYLKHYDSPKFLGPISEVPVEKLKELVASGKHLHKITEKTVVASAMAQELLQICRSL